MDLGKNLEAWGTSDEIEDLKALDEKFKASEDGKALMEEWKEFGEALHGAIEETENGIHIHNSHMDELEDEAEDIEDEYEHLEHTHWNKDFHDAFEAAFTNDEWTGVAKAGEAFKHSKQGHALKSEVEDLFHALEDEVKVSDIPEHWKEQMEHGMH